MILKTKSILLSVLELLVFLFGIVSNYTSKEISAVSCCICLVLFCLIWIAAKTTNTKISPFYAGEFFLFISVVPILNKLCYKIELFNLFLYAVPASIVLYSLIKGCVCYKKESATRIFMKKLAHYYLVLLFSFTWLVQINMCMDFYPDQTYMGSVLSKSRTSASRFGPTYTVSVQYTDGNGQSVKSSIPVDQKTYLQMEDHCSVILEHYAGALQSPYVKLVADEQAETVRDR